MPIQPVTAKVTNLDTALDAEPVQTTDGAVIWATVTIDYTWCGLSPAVTIRVPVPWNEHESEADRRGAALRSARQLIDHACQAAGIPGVQDSPHSIPDKVKSIVPAALQGVAQELGLVEPTTKPKRQVNANH